MKHAMPQLPYTMEALAPLMSQETLEYHYGKHLQTYVDNLNKLIAGTPFEDMSLEDIICKADGGIFNNAAQAWNHTFFFETLTAQPQDIPASVADKLAKDYHSLRFGMGMAGRRCRQETLHPFRTERRQPADPRHEAHPYH